MPVRSVASVWRNRCTSSVQPPGRLMPAAFTSTSGGSFFWPRSSNTRLMALSSARSQASAVTPFAAVPERLRPNTVAPAAAKPLAIAAPMPREAPVTSASFPSSEKLLRSGIAVAAHDGRTQFDIFKAIDLEHLVTIHQMHPDAAAKPVVLFAQQRGDENVERAVLK